MAIINPQTIGGGGVPEEKYNATVNSFLGDVDANGVLLAPTVPANIIFTGVKGIAAYDANNSVLVRKFHNLTTITSASFPDLDNLTTKGALGNCFSGCTSLTSVSFPALKTTSFGSTNKDQLNNLVSGVIGCAIHFPSNLSSKVSSLTGYPNFGGTNTSVLFDLPATN